MQQPVRLIEKVLRSRINQKKSHNRRMEEYAAYGGSMTGPRNIKSYKKEEGFLEALRYINNGTTIGVPNWLQEDVEEYIKKEEKRNDPDWEEYQRLKKKFEDE